MPARILAAGAAAASCAGLIWLTCVLLLTRQTDLLLALMAATGVAAVCLALYAKRKGWRALFAIALICMALAAVLAFMAVADIIEPGIAGPDVLSCLEHTL